MAFPWAIIPPILGGLGGLFGGLFGGNNEPDFAQVPPDWRYEYGRDEFWPWFQEYMKNQGALDAPYQNFRFQMPEGFNPITIQRMDPRTKDYLNLANSFFANAPGPAGQFYNNPSTLQSILTGAALGGSLIPSSTTSTSSNPSVFEQPGSNAGTGLLTPGTMTTAPINSNSTAPIPTAPANPQYPVPEPLNPVPQNSNVPWGGKDQDAMYPFYPGYSRDELGRVLGTMKESMRPGTHIYPADSTMSPEMKARMQGALRHGDVYMDFPRIERR